MPDEVDLVALPPTLRDQVSAGLDAVLAELPDAIVALAFDELRVAVQAHVTLPGAIHGELKTVLRRRGLL